MRIIFFAGGTLGHITPAIELVNQIKKRYSKSYIVFVATIKDKSYEIINNSKCDKVMYFECYSTNFNIKKHLLNFKVYQQIKKIIKEEDINVAYGFGGYISGIGVFAASNLNLDIYIHEQNSVIGKANKLSAKKANKVFLSFPIKEKNKNFELVGSPVYHKALQVKKQVYKEKHKVLFTSGTLGAKVINQLAVNLIVGHCLDDYNVTIITGKKYYDDVKKLLRNYNIEVIAFSNNLIEEIASSEVVISRAGSSTLFEIIGTNTLSIVIPSTNVTNNHQYYNALYFNDLKCIEMINEDDLTINNFLNSFNKIIKSKQIYYDNIKKLKMENVIDKMIGVLNNE